MDSYIIKLIVVTEYEMRNDPNNASSNCTAVRVGQTVNA